MRMFLGQSEEEGEIPPHVEAYRAAADASTKAFVESDGAPAATEKTAMQKLMVPLGVAVAAYLFIKG